MTGTKTCTRKNAATHLEAAFHAYNLANGGKEVCANDLPDLIAKLQSDYYAMPIYSISTLRLALALLYGEGVIDFDPDALRGDGSGNPVVVTVLVNP